MVASRKKKFVVGTAALTAAALGFGTDAANAADVFNFVLDFEEYNDGDIIGGNIGPFVHVTVDNYNGDRDLGVAWDATGYPGNPQLRGHQVPWLTGSIPSDYDPGIGFMIQGIPSVIPRPEGARPSGEYRFTFSQDILSFGLDVFDIDGEREFNTPTGDFISFYKNGVKVASVDYVDLITPGNPAYDPNHAYGQASANRLAPITGRFDEVIVAMGGSGFIDNVRYSIIPSPAAAGAGMVMAGLALLRRRTR